MITIPYTEFTTWIKQQPPDRAIDMGQSTIENPCGCLMIQYARAHGIPCTSVGFHQFVGAYTTLDAEGTALIHRCLDNHVTTYSQVIPLL